MQIYFGINRFFPFSFHSPLRIIYTNDTVLTEVSVSFTTVGATSVADFCAVVILKGKHHGHFNFIFRAFGALSLIVTMPALISRCKLFTATLSGDVIWQGVAFACQCNLVSNV